ncbi:MAG: hypothetical protein QM730_29675 [Anaerolineales bacterium]
MKKQIIIPLIAVFLVSTFAIVRMGSTNAASSAEVSYAKDVRPILESHCASCHMGEFVSKGLDMSTYESLMEGSEDGPVIDPGDAKHSLLIEKVTEGKMPKRGPKLTPEQIQILTDWINASAPNN